VAKAGERPDKKICTLEGIEGNRGLKGSVGPPRSPPKMAKDTAAVRPTLRL